MTGRGAKVPPGIRRTPKGWQAFVHTAQGYRSKRFGPNTPFRTMQDWRETARVELKTGHVILEDDQTPTAPTFGDDARRYLESVTAMPTYAERAAHVALWVAEFGDRARPTIQAIDIATVLHRWRSEGLGADTCNKRRTALMHLWHALDGKSSRNPVRDAPRFRPPSPQPRGLPYSTVRAILEAMPPSKTRARLQVMAWTGIPPAELMRLKPEHVHLKERWVWIPGREKGKGTEPRVLPLTAEGVRAFREFAREDAWGTFQHAPMGLSFQRACKKLDLTGLVPYDFRHSFGTAVYLATGDIKATQEALGHSSPQLTARYALAAVEPRLQLAIHTFGQHARKRAPKNRTEGRKVAKMLPRRRRSVKST